MVGGGGRRNYVFFFKALFIGTGTPDDDVTAAGDAGLLSLSSSTNLRNALISLLRWWVVLLFNCA